MTSFPHNLSAHRGACALVSLCLAACGGGGGDGANPAPAADDSPSSGPTYTVGGTVAGLAGAGLVLQLNGAGDLSVQGDGPFTFGTALAAGSTYSVTALAHPASPAQLCTVANGSGTADANVAAVQVSCVTNPVTLLSADPADRSSDVQRSVQPSLVFSAELDPAAVTGATVTLAEADGTAVAGTLAVNAATVGIAPSTLLWPDAEYRLGIDGVLGRFGEPLAHPLQTSFITRDGQWSADSVTPMRTTSLLSVESHRVAVARDGTAVAAWREGNRAGQWRIWASRRGADAVWQNAVEVGPAVLGTAEAPALVMSPDGTAHIAWSSASGIGGRQQVFASRLGAADADWSAPVQFSLDTLLTNIEPALGVGARGMVYAAWKASSTSSNPYDIHLARRQDDGTWSPPVIANDVNGRDVFAPAVAVAGDGQAQLVWIEQNGADYALKWRPYRPDISSPEPLQPAADIGGPAGQGVQFSLALNAAGQGVLAWQVFDVAGAAPQTLWAASKAGPLDPWSAALALDGDATDDRSPQTAVDQAGNRFVVWQGTAPSGLDRIVGRQLAAGAASSGWSPAREISDSAGGEDPALAVDARGNALVLWRPTNSEVRGARFTRRQGWKAPEPVAQFGSGYLFAPRVAFDGSGSAVAIWSKTGFIARTAAGTGEGFAIDGARFD